MSEAIPRHEGNANTLATEPLQLFEVDASERVAARAARPRPADRPRVAPPHEAAGADTLVIFEMKAEAAPPGLKAKARPAGREREVATDSAADGVRDES